MSGRQPIAPSISASALLLMACGALAQAPAESHAEPDYTPLGLANRPVANVSAAGHAGSVQLGLGYTSGDNYRFGEYNGLHKQGVSAISSLYWQDFRSSDNYWQLSLSDLGLDTREGRLTWGRAERLRLTVGFDSQQQVRNDSGRTPFRGDTFQQLPADWVSGQTTSEFTALDGALREFDRVLNRDKLFLGLDARLSDNWRLRGNLSYEEKQGHAETGAGIYIDASGADAVLLRTPVDYATTEFDLGLAYDRERLHLQGQLAYSHFNNADSLLVWRNPYNAFGPNVAYPNGTGGLGLAPDNRQTSGRLTGHYIFSARARLQFDGSHAVASQDQDYADYTVNRALLVGEPLPAGDFGGDVATSTANVRLLLTPMPGLNTELFYRLRDRDYDADRNGYLYVRGDGSDQPGPAATVYNTTHDLTSQTAGFDVNYRLPRRARLGFEYAYEEVERRNAPVDKTEEDRYTVKFRMQPWDRFSSNLHLRYAERAADTYEWAQDYYALLDARLINATPDNQRFNNHPLLMKYYMANRERWESGADLSFLPDERWNLNLNLLWRNDDYDQSALGLTGSIWHRAHASASYVASDALSGSVYAGYDRYRGDQASRVFRGGPEKNPFEIYPPLPQASDPRQDWDLRSTDTSITVGANLQWRFAPDLEFTLEYSFVDTRAQQSIATRPGGSVSATSLPDVDTRLHQVEASAIWHLRDDLSLQLDYQFYSYSSNDWAWRGVQADTIGKVLTFGQTNPNEDIHYVGASVTYRWQ